MSNPNPNPTPTPTPSPDTTQIEKPSHELPDDIPVPKDPDPNGTVNFFIYGGPWIYNPKPSMFLDEITPMNVQLSGMFKKSYAYYSLKERMPGILTRVIDVGSKRRNPGFVAAIAKLKHDLVTNKPYEKFTAKGEEYEFWNEWIEAQSPKNYFGNNWCFTECYIYRKIVEAAELNQLKDFDPFEEVKNQAVAGAVEPMCVVAEKLLQHIEPTEEKPVLKARWVELIKVSLWANRCDLSVSAGEKCDIQDVCPKPILAFPKPGAKPKPLKKGKLPPVAPPLTDLGYFDPFQVTLDLKFNLLTDDSAKSFDQLYARSNKIRKGIEKIKDRSQPEPDWNAMFPLGGKKKEKGKKKPPPPPPPAEGEAPAEPEEPPKNIPCPAKMTVPQFVFLDIVCDNTGYELFTDLCLAHFALAQSLVDKVRIHVKKYPWFVSDAMKKDVNYLINYCKSASFNKTAIKPKKEPPPPKPGAEPEPPPEEEPPRIITSQALNQVANEWQKFIDEGKFMILDEDYWTYPHPYNKMKQYDWFQYRSLQYAAIIVFKGDLNYRKLVGERKCIPQTTLEPNLQGFIPAPLVAVRTIKSETVCALQKGRYPQICEFDKDWMEKGNFGVIQLSKKAEPFPKQPDRPCIDYGQTCFGERCPEHADI